MSTYIPMGFVSEETICDVKYKRYPALLTKNVDGNRKTWNGHVFDNGTLASLQGDNGSIQEGKADFNILKNMDLMVSYDSKSLISKIYSFIENVYFFLLNIHHTG